MSSTALTRSFLVVLVSLFILTLSSTVAGAQTAAQHVTFTVNTTADTHDVKPGDGTCADKQGKCSLRAAIEEADALPHGSRITITAPTGAYQLTLGTLWLTANTITINGASRKTTIIEGNRKFTVMSISANVSAHFSQLTIEGGNAGYGGGIYNTGNGTLTVSSSTLSNNSATIGGGGIYNFGGKVSVRNSTLSNNSAGKWGGGIDDDNGGTLTVSNSTLSNNSAYAGGGIYNTNNGTVTMSSSTLRSNTAPYGGGIYNASTVFVSSSTLSNNSAPYNGSGGGINNQGALNVSDSTLSGNSASSGGGGIENGSYSTVIVNRSILSGNSAPYGGGIENDNGGTMNVDSSTLSGNSASTYGGGIENWGGVNVDSSTLSGNSASTYGGGVDNWGDVTMSSSTLSDNSASTGGGINNTNNGTVSVSNSTLSGNSAATNGNGGGIYSDGMSATLTGTIVANSTGLNCAGTITDGGYNLDSGATCGFTKFALNNTDPQLGPLGNNGGPTQTMALLQGSPAIDYVARRDCPASDQRNYARPDHRESACDIGAYESAY